MIKSEDSKPVLYSLIERSLKFSQSEVCVCNLRIIIINASHELLTHIYLPHFAAEAENNLRIENKRKNIKKKKKKHNKRTTRKGERE